jgi:GT2 family glycosyltransferase
VLVFLNDDVKPLVPDWLASLVAHAQRPEVGAVGAKLLYPSGILEHTGIAIGIMDGCGHPLRHTYGSRFWHWHEFTRDVSAVTGACLAVRKSVFEELGGLNEEFPVNYGDADFCLRARQAGYRVIYEPAAVLCHHECKTRAPGTRHDERELWYRRWAALLAQGDPFYNPNLTTTREDGSLRFEP